MLFSSLEWNGVLPVVTPLYTVFEHFLSTIGKDKEEEEVHDPQEADTRDSSEEDQEESDPEGVLEDEQLREGKRGNRE